MLAVLGAEHGQHLLGVGFPVGGAVQVAARRQPARQQRHQRRLDQAALVVPKFVPGVGEPDHRPGWPARSSLAAPRRRRAGRCAGCAGRSPMRLSRAPTPGSCTSTPMKSVPWLRRSDLRPGRPCRSRSPARSGALRPERPSGASVVAKGSTKRGPVCRAHAAGRGRRHRRNCGSGASRPWGRIGFGHRRWQARGPRCPQAPPPPPARSQAADDACAATRGSGRAGASRRLRRIHVTQSTVSMRVKALEGRLGVRLLSVPSPAPRQHARARRLQRYARTMVLAWEERGNIRIPLPWIRCGNRRPI